MTGYVWVSMEIGRVDQLKFGAVVILPEDSLIKGTSGLMPLSGVGYDAVQRIPSSDVAIFVEKAIDCILPPSDDPRGTRDSTSYANRGETNGENNLRDRLSIRPPPDDEEPETKEFPDVLRTLWIDYDAHGDRHKPWRDFAREATFEVYKDWPFDDGRSSLLYMVKHFEKHGGDGLSWMAGWLRQNEMNEHERTSIEMKCLITCLYVSGTYDQLDSPCVASMETIARRIAQIVEGYSGDGGRPRWAGVHHYEGRNDAMSCFDPNLRVAVAKKTREELDLENLRGKFTGTGRGARQGSTPTDAGESSPLEMDMVLCWAFSLLPSFHELGPRPQRRKQVRAWLSDKRCEEDVDALITSLNWCCGLKHRLQLTWYLRRDKIW